MNLRNYLILFITFLGASTAFAETSTFGKITSLEISGGGVLFRLDEGRSLPADCAQASDRRFVIDDKHKSMISGVLAAWMSGRTTLTIWSEPLGNFSFCPVGRIEFK